MAELTLTNLSETVWQALVARAAANGRSPENEAREMLTSAVQARPEKVRLGSLLAGIGREVGLTDEEVEMFNTLRDKTPTRVVNFNDPA